MVCCETFNQGPSWNRKLGEKRNFAGPVLDFLYTLLYVNFRKILNFCWSETSVLRIWLVWYRMFHCHSNRKSQFDVVFFPKTLFYRFEIIIMVFRKYEKIFRWQTFVRLTNNDIFMTKFLWITFPTNISLTINQYLCFCRILVLSSTKINLIRNLKVTWTENIDQARRNFLRALHFGTVAK